MLNCNFVCDSLINNMKDLNFKLTQLNELFSTIDINNTNELNRRFTLFNELFSTIDNLAEDYIQQPKSQLSTPDLSKFQILGEDNIREVFKYKSPILREVYKNGLINFS